MSSGENASSRKKSLNGSTSLANWTACRGEIAFVDVVQQLDLVAQLLAALFQHFQRAPDVGSRLIDGIVVKGLHFGRRRGSAPGAVAGHAGDADLQANVAVALRHGLARAVDDLRDFVTADARVTRRGFAAFAPEELIHGHAGLTALDVPQRLVHAADRVVEHRAVPPVGGVVAHLPGVLDAVGGPADQQRPQVFLHCRRHQVGPLREGCAPVTVQAVLVGGDLDDNQPDPARLSGDDGDVLDFWRGHSARGGRSTFS